MDWKKLFSWKDMKKDWRETPKTELLIYCDSCRDKKIEYTERGERTSLRIPLALLILTFFWIIIGKVWRMLWT